MTKFKYMDLELRTIERMEKELYFIIDDKKIFLEQVLVDYMDIPIFFLCKSVNDYFVALCTDIEESKYIVVRVTLTDVYCLLHEQLPMRDIILKQKEYWNVTSDEDINMDLVKKQKMEELDLSCLPEQGACYQVLTSEMEAYVKKFDNEFFRTDSFTIGKHKVDAWKIVEANKLEMPSEKVESFVKTGEISIKGLSAKQSNSIPVLYERIPDVGDFYKRIATWAMIFTQWMFDEEDSIAA